MGEIVPSSNRSLSGHGPIRDVYWPQLKKMIQQDPSVLEELQIDCPICYENMSTDTGIQANQSQTTEALHLPMVASCGHVFGAACLHQLFISEDYRGTCPLCSASWKHECCHMNQGCRLQTLVDRLDGGPKTFVEGGKLLSGCHECTIKNWAENFSQQVKPILDPRKLAPEESFEVVVYNGPHEVYNSGGRFNPGAHALKRRDVDIGESANEMVEMASKELAEMCMSNWWDVPADKLVLEVNACEWVYYERDLQMALLRVMRHDELSQPAPAQTEQAEFAFFDDGDGDADEFMDNDDDDDDNDGDNDNDNDDDDDDEMEG